jgi:hypothetical protein
MIFMNLNTATLFIIAYKMVFLALTYIFDNIFIFTFFNLI